MQDESSEEASAPFAASVSGGSSVARPVCDQCRHRKIGCDKNLPCSGCTKAGLDCKFTSIQRPKIRRQRVLISAQYERKIDAIEENLDQVVHLLGRLSSQIPQASSSSSQAPSPSRQQTPSSGFTPAAPSAAPQSRPLSHAATSTNTPMAAFEGGSSLYSQTEFANSLIENAVGEGPLSLRPGMRDALGALRSLLETQKQNSVLNDERRAPPSAEIASPAGPVRFRPLPPVEMTMQSLRLAREDRRLTFIVLSFMLDIDRFMDYVLRVYYPGEFSDADFIIVNTGLYALFTERDLIENDHAVREQLTLHCKTCRENMVAALESLPLRIPATWDYALALAMAGCITIELNLFSLGSVVVNSALYLVQKLGYHRIQTMRNDTPQVRKAKICIFWMLYVLDKDMSLRLGRPSTAQDYDITIPLPAPESDDPAKESPYIYTFIRWIKLSRLQGEAYRLLYSPAAANQPQSVIAARASHLAAQIRVLHQELLNPPEQVQKHHEYWDGVLENRMMEMFRMSDQVLYLAILTLVLRAVPASPGSPTSFIAECVTTARQALDLHGECVSRLSPASMVMLDFYIKWTVLYTPFVPFIVVFCHCIETVDTSDLDRLSAFVSTLSGAAEIYDAISNLHRLFHALEVVAKQYIELKTAAESETTPQAGVREQDSRELEAYLTALGIMPGLQPPPQPVLGGVQQPGCGCGGGGGGGEFANHDNSHYGLGPVDEPGMATPGAVVALPTMATTAGLTGRGGTPPTAGLADMGGMSDASTTFGMGQQGSLENWFYNGQQLYLGMEEDGGGGIFRSVGGGG